MPYKSILQLTAGNETIYLCIVEKTKAVVGCLVAEKVSDCVLTLKWLCEQMIGGVLLMLMLKLSLYRTGKPKRPPSAVSYSECN